jgi:hypothetical protein
VLVCKWWCRELSHPVPLGLPGQSYYRTHDTAHADVDVESRVEVAKSGLSARAVGGRRLARGLPERHTRLIPRIACLHPRVPVQRQRQSLQPSTGGLERLAVSIPGGRRTRRIGAEPVPLQLYQVIREVEGHADQYARPFLTW